MSVVCVVQARMGSSRLPGKVLMDVGGEPLVAHVMERIRSAQSVDHVVVATSTDPKDDPLVALASDRGWDIFRGDEGDVLSRFSGALARWPAETVVRVTADCPLLDPSLIDACVNELRSGAFDYVSNTLDPRTFPRGLDVEVFSAAALRVADREDLVAASREHVTPYLYRNPTRFSLGRVVAPESRDYSSWRVTVDTEDDLHVVRCAVQHLRKGDYSWQHLLDVLGAHTEWSRQNAAVEQKAVPF